MSYTVYHACEQKGGADNVLQNSPFHSDAKRQHWLTEGYYFWRSNSLAQKWGYDSYDSDGNFAILKAGLSIEEDELFDLVANTEDMEHFEKLLSKFMNFMKEELGTRYEPTVSACLKYFRKKSENHPDLFPYIAIMAAEDSHQNMDIQFVNGRQICIALNKRVQLCLFKGNENRIIDKELIYPEAWVA